MVLVVRVLQDTIAWNSAIAACASCYEWEQAVQLLAELYHADLLPMLGPKAVCFCRITLLSNCCGLAATEGCPQTEKTVCLFACLPACLSSILTFVSLSKQERAYIPVRSGRKRAGFADNHGSRASGSCPDLASVLMAVARRTLEEGPGSER